MEDKVRQLAYLKWEAAGYPYGDGVEFWLQAEEEVNSSCPKTCKKSDAPKKVAAKAVRRK